MHSLQHLFSASGFNVSVSVCLCKSVCDCCGLDKAIDNRHNTSTTLSPRPQHTHNKRYRSTFSFPLVRMQLQFFVSFSISAPHAIVSNILSIISNSGSCTKKIFVVIAMREHYVNIKTDFGCPAASPFRFTVLSLFRSPSASLFASFYQAIPV